METFAFRRFRLRPKTRANRSFEVTQLVGFQGLKLVEYFEASFCAIAVSSRFLVTCGKIGIQAEARLPTLIQL